MTVAAILCFLALLFLGGLPLAMLLPRDTQGRRVLLMPVLGVCALVLLSLLLASFGLTGKAISVMVLIAAVAALAFAIARNWLWRPGSSRWQPISGPEWRAASPGLLAGLLAVGLIGWPLFLSGYANYWGFANPDAAYYMTIIDHLDNHAFSQPDVERVDAYRGTEAQSTSAILGLCYLPAVVSVLTGIKSYLLFQVLCTVILFLVADSTYLLSRVALGLSRSGALIPAFLVACSAVVADTFYKSSLGALTVAALSPAILVLGILYAERSAPRVGVLLAVVLAASLFAYYPGFGILSVVLAGALIAPLIRGKLSVRSLAWSGSTLILLTGAVYARQALILIHSLAGETFSSRMVNGENELLQTFNQVLTGRFVAFVWGLRILGLSTGERLDDHFPVSTLVGILLFVITILAFRRSRASIPVEFKGALTLLAVIVATYFATRNGYGVYKLITWTVPLLIVALSGAALAFLSRKRALPRAFAATCLFGYVSLNLWHTIRLGTYSLGGPALTELHSAPDLSLSEMLQLRTGEEKARSRQLFIAVPDPVVQRWETPFQVQPNVHFLPTLTLDVQDSDSVAATANFKAAAGHYADGDLLYLTGGIPDIVRPPEGPSVWRSNDFAISSLSDVRDALVLGAGWYRREHFPGIWSPPPPFHWMRKRAELLLLNPSPAPHRLILTVLAGYGNPSPVRHLILLQDGQVFDEATISGYARFITHPFLPTRKVSHLEILVQEDALPMPRTGGWLDVWAPTDTRRLNLAVFEIGIAPANAPSGCQSRVDFRSGLQFPAAEFNGIYPDRWMGQRASMDMCMPRNATALNVRGMAPGVAPLAYPLSLHVYAAGVPLGSAILQKPGNFDISMPLPDSSRESSREVSLTLENASSCFSSSGDPRCLTLLLDQVAFTAPPDSAPLSPPSSH